MSSRQLKRRQIPEDDGNNNNVPTFRFNTFRARQRRFRVRRGGASYNTHKFKFRGKIDISSDSSGIILASFPIIPTLWDGSNPFPEWTNMQALFDSYKVTGVKFKWVPDKPNDTSTTTGYKPMYNAQDFDSYPTTPTVANLMEYDTFSVFGLDKPWSKYYKIKRFTGGATTILGNGMIDIASPINQGAIMFRADGLDLSDNYGSFIVTYYVTLSNRR